MSVTTVATCNLNQWALDFDGNLTRIIESIQEAKRQGAKYRLGPELEVPGYGCEDHFLEMDTFEHCWQSICKLLDSDVTDGIICDIGMPVLHCGVRYNCRVYLLNRRVLLIRPKMFMADDGNYRESRYFTSWSEQKMFDLEEHSLPISVSDLIGQESCPFGIAIVQCRDGTIATETCEELFTARSPHIALGLDGAEIITNGSGSHHQLRKLHQRMNLMLNATAKTGGAYLYANQQGCDGSRLYYDGCASILCNGETLAQASQFSMKDVEVLVATIDLDDIRSFRGAIASRGAQARSQRTVPHVRTDFRLCFSGLSLSVVPTRATAIAYHTPAEEIAMGPAAWLWDYLRRSGASGFMLPLSGGADSASVAAIVGVMCNMVHAACRAGDEQVQRDVRRITGSPSGELPESPQALANFILHSVYMGTTNSGDATRRRAKQLAAEIGGMHLDANIDAMVSAVLTVVEAILGAVHRPKFEAHGGTYAQDVALQNVQARLRMVLNYMLAQLLPGVRGRKGFLLVLSSGNVDEALRGYLTKYDCSSGDLNPIGGVSKGDLKMFMRYAADKFEYPTLHEIAGAPPSAELRPHDAAAEHSQLDEVEMGMTYEELGFFGRLRKIHRCGPVGMFKKLAHEWAATCTPAEVAGKVKHFFKQYAINRHKSTVLTPSYHAENYSPDDNRFDLRPFLYPVQWTRQFDTIDQLASEMAE